MTQNQAIYQPQPTPESRYLGVPLKYFPAFIATIYIIGYLLTACNLRQYKIQPLSLFEVQYLGAGLPIFLYFFINITVLKIISRPDRLQVRIFGRNFSEQTKNFFAQRMRYHLIVHSILILIFSIIVTMYLLEIKPFCNMGLFLTIITFIYSNITFWIFHYYLHLMGNSGIANENLIPGWNSTNSLMKYIPTFYAITIPFNALVWLAISPFFAQSVYKHMPPILGGSKITVVRLILDKADIPDVISSQLLQDDTGLTVPLNLIFRSQTQYIVENTQEKDRAENPIIYVLNDDWVIGEIINSP